MPLNARSKGQRGEREVCQLLQPVVNKVYEMHGLVGPDCPMLERNLMQSHKGGYDLVGLEWLALEVKRHENVALNRSGVIGWWEQTRRQSGPEQEPVLFYRPNVTQWSVRMYGYLAVGPWTPDSVRVKVPVTIDAPAFLAWFEQRLHYELKRRIR